MPSFLTISIHDAELAGICHQHRIKRFKVHEDIVKYSEEYEGEGGWLDKVPEGGDLVDWLISFIKQRKLATEAVCCLIRDKSSDINNGLVSSRIVYEYCDPKDYGSNEYWEEERDANHIEIKGFNARTWEEVWESEDHNEIAELYGKGDVESMSPNNYPLWLFLLEGWQYKSNSFFRKMMDSFGTIRFTKGTSFDNPELEFFRSRIIDPVMIDFSKKTISMPVVSRLNYDDEDNKHYGSYRTAYDIAKRIIELSGGKVQLSISSNTDYAVVSSRMRIKDNSNPIRIVKEYQDYCLIQKSEKNSILECDEKRKKKNQPEICVITEDAFHGWLKSKYNEIMLLDNDALQQDGTICITIWPRRAVPENYKLKFKSKHFAGITQQQLEVALDSADSLSAFVSNVESKTKSGAFAESGNTKKSDYNRLLELDGKYSFSDIKEILITYSSSDGSRYRFYKKPDPGFDNYFIYPQQLDNLDLLVWSINSILKKGRTVKVVCKQVDEYNMPKCIERLGEIGRIIDNTGIVKSEPEKENQSISIMISPR